MSRTDPPRVDPHRRRTSAGEVAIVAVLLAAAAAATAAAAVDDAEVAARAEAGDWHSLAALGPESLPELVRLYRAGDPERRADLANFFYWVGWKSEAMLADAHTENRRLRLQVQWALGRVSDDQTVVDTLLDTMVHDPEPLFREKAACGLANDQIHLTGAQKARLFERLLAQLESPSAETRALTIRILHASTGQAKGFHPNLPPEKRAESVARWRRWLDEYRAAL